MLKFDKGQIISKLHTFLEQLQKLLLRAAFVTQYYSKKLAFQFKKRAPALKKVHFDSFPAVHLKKMDWMDCVFKFSGEFVILVLAIGVSGFNLFYFSGSDAKDFTDKSLASKFLKNHYALNEKLYEKNNSIVTVVSHNSFIPQAQADDFSGLEVLANSAQTTGNEIVLGDDDSILAPNPDSILAQVNNAVKIIYQTQEGDSLKSIATKYGVSVDSIRWSNPSLTSSTIKPGWDLIIPPVNGVAVYANSNTTLPDLAIKYNPERYNPDKKVRDQSAAKLLESIIYFNGLGSAEDINDGDFLVIPGGVVAVPPQPTPTPRSATRPRTPRVDNSLNAVTSVSDGYDDEGHRFPKGYCTYYVASRTKITFGGNAKNWLANARASGYTTGSEPAPRSVVVTTDDARYGHVAYVEEVANGKILVTEMNYVGFNKISQRWIPINSKTIRGYIYP